MDGEGVAAHDAVAAGRDAATVGIGPALHALGAAGGLVGAEGAALLVEVALASGDAGGAAVGFHRGGGG